MVNITWYGHSCFELKSENCGIVFDPYEENYVRGLKMPHLSADKVISSHLHRDHYAPDMITLTGNEPDAVIVQFPCFHDDAGGRKRGENLVSVVETEGLRICHMGDIGHMLSAEQVAALGKIDVLMLPVGGFFTIDAVTAKALCDAIKPKTIVPMHYKGKGKGLPVIAPVKDFLKLFDEGDVCFLTDHTVSCDELLKHKIAVFPW